LELDRAAGHLVPRGGAAAALVTVLAAVYAVFSVELPVPAGSTSALADPQVLRNVYLTGFRVGYAPCAGGWRWERRLPAWSSAWDSVPF
jgi:hypothetical protein